MFSRFAVLLALTLGLAVPAFADTPAEPGPCPDACDCLSTCGPPGRVWASAEWLYWAASGQPLPALATSGPTTAAPSLAGNPASPMTDILFGGRRGNNDFRNGLRANVGTWLNDEQTFGLEGEFFFLGRSRDTFAAVSGDGSRVIARPFFNALLGVPDVELVSYPGFAAGALIADSRSWVIGGGLNAVKNLCCGPCGRVDFLAGYRYLNLADELTVQEDLTSLGGAGRVPAGYRYQITDRFRTNNDFHGGVLGIAAERRMSQLFLGVKASVALGATYQTANIEGGTMITPPGGTGTAYPGGLLALPTNIGRYEQTRFAVLPQIGVQAGANLGEHARVFVGYDFLYLSDVQRAGDQVDLRVNPNFLPPAASTTGPAVPAYPAKTTDFWLQGVSVGVQVRF